MTLQYRLALFLAALSLLFIAECVRLGQTLGTAWRDYERAVGR